MDEPPDSNENNKSGYDHAGIIHIPGLDRHDKWEAEEYDCYSNIQQRDDVYSKPSLSKVERARDDGFAASEYVWEDSTGIGERR